MSRTPLSVLRRVLVGTALLVFACSEEAPPAAKYRAQVAEGCLLDSDCNAPLVCAFRKCHQQCRVDRDCPATEYCAQTNLAPLAVCLQVPEQTCALNSDCPEPLLCSSKAQCRDGCRTSRDCLEGQVCETGTCRSDGASGAGGGATVTTSSEGGTCSYTSECKEPLVCRAGTCVVDCKTNADCPLLATCEGGSCKPRSPDGTVYCVPGATYVCDCPDGQRGAQTCVDDGSRVGPCDKCP